MRVHVHFRCCECERWIDRRGSNVRPDPVLCGDCIFVPGWFRSLPLRLRIAPAHTGAEPQLAAVPAWEPTP